MALAHPVVNALLGSFQESIVRLGGVVVYETTSKFFLTMADGIMGRKIPSDDAIRMEFIAHQMGLVADNSLDEGLQHRDTVTGNRCGPHRPVTLYRNSNTALLGSTAALMFDA